MSLRTLYTNTSDLLLRATVVRNTAVGFWVLDPPSQSLVLALPLLQLPSQGHNPHHPSRSLTAPPEKVASLIAKRCLYRAFPTPRPYSLVALPLSTVRQVTEQCQPSTSALCSQTHLSAL